MKNPTAIPTVQELIAQRIKERGISRSQLVQATGYKNISKGIRRLNEFLRTLKAPSDQYFQNLISVLDVDGALFWRSFNRSQRNLAEAADAEAQEKFRPYLEILISFTPRPWFAYQIVHNRCIVILPWQIQNLPFSEELSAIASIYKNKANSDLLKDRTTGFRYHRKHNYSMEFSSDHVLRNIESVKPVQKQQTRGTRMIDLLFPIC